MHLQTLCLLPLFSLISLASAAPLGLGINNNNINKRLLGLGSSSSGLLDILDPLTAPLDPVLDPLLSVSEPVTDLLSPVTAPLSSLLDPVTDLVGDALDLLVPTLLVCADVGADVLGLVDVGVCACVGLENGGVWVDSDAGVDVTLPGLIRVLATKVRLRDETL